MLLRRWDFFGESLDCTSIFLNYYWARLFAWPRSSRLLSSSLSCWSFSLLSWKLILLELSISSFLCGVIGRWFIFCVSFFLSHSSLSSLSSSEWSWFLAICIFSYSFRNVVTYLFKSSSSFCYCNAPALLELRTSSGLSVLRNYYSLKEILACKGFSIIICYLSSKISCS